MKTDSLFYRLFQADPALAFELAGLTVPEPKRYRFVSVEVKQTAFRLDGVLRNRKSPPSSNGFKPTAAKTRATGLIGWICWKPSWFINCRNSHERKYRPCLISTKAN